MATKFGDMSLEQLESLVKEIDRVLSELSINDQKDKLALELEKIPLELARKGTIKRINDLRLMPQKIGIHGDTKTSNF